LNPDSQEITLSILGGKFFAIRFDMQDRVWHAIATDVEAIACVGWLALAKLGARTLLASNNRIKPTITSKISSHLLVFFKDL